MSDYQPDFDQETDPMVPWPIRIPDAIPKEGVSESTLEFVSKARQKWARLPLEESEKWYHAIVGKLQQPDSNLRDQNRAAWQACALIEPLILANRLNWSRHLLKDETRAVISTSEAYVRLCRAHGRLITFDDELPEFPYQGTDHWNANYSVLHLLQVGVLVEAQPKLEILEGLIFYFWPNLQEVSAKSLDGAKQMVALISRVQKTLQTHPGSGLSRLSNLLGETEELTEMVLSFLVSDGRIGREWHSGEWTYYRRADATDM
jgi:hypothetical protein